MAQLLDHQMQFEDAFYAFVTLPVVMRDIA